ncbi:MAG: hypothetical protein R3F03_12290 [Opitutaceae bacterium]
MNFIAQLMPPVKLARMQEVALSPLCHSSKIYARTTGEYWLETSANLYRLQDMPSGLVVAAISDMRPCADFFDLLDVLGIKAKIKKVYRDDEKPEIEWDDIVKKYGLPQPENARSIGDSFPKLTSTEEEVLRAIQLLAVSSNEWLDVALFARGFASNLSTTLQSLRRKGLIAYRQTEMIVRLR